MKREIVGRAKRSGARSRKDFIFAKFGIEWQK